MIACHLHVEEYMVGSKPLIVYRLKSTPERTKKVQDIIKTVMEKKEYIWYRDIFIEWSSSLIIIEIYHQDLLQEIKEVLMEEFI